MHKLEQIKPALLRELRSCLIDKDMLLISNIIGYHINPHNHHHLFLLKSMRNAILPHHPPKN